MDFALGMINLFGMINDFVMGKPYQIRYGDRLLVVNGG